jgi:hypothetical protein
MQDGKPISPSPTAQLQARRLLNQRREREGLLPVYGDGEFLAVLKRDGLCKEPVEPVHQRTAKRHYVKA